MQVATTVAAIAGLLTAISGLVFTAIKLRDERRDRNHQLAVQRERWEAEFANQRQQWGAERKATMRTQFLTEIVTRRLDTYGDVLATLGAVRDISEPSGDHRDHLLANRDALYATADAILAHLYGQPGLVMSMQTRNQLLTTWYACHLFTQGSTDVENLVEQFFRARRALRSDLQIDDASEPISIASIEKDLGSG